MDAATAACFMIGPLTRLGQTADRAMMVAMTLTRLPALCLRRQGQYRLFGGPIGR